MPKTALDWIAYVLVIIGGINWGLMSFDFNLVALIFGGIPILLTIVYALVGLSAIYMIFKRG